MIIFLNSTALDLHGFFECYNSILFMKMNSEDFDEREKKMLENKAKEVVETITEGVDTKGNPREKFIEEKKEGEDPASKIPRVWDPLETDFLVNNRKNLSNKEMKEFLEGDSELHQYKEELKQFSKTEERFLQENFSHLDTGQIAEKLDKKEKVVSLKAKLMGLRTY